MSVELTKKNKPVAGAGFTVTRCVTCGQTGKVAREWREKAITPDCDKCGGKGWHVKKTPAYAAQEKLVARLTDRLTICQLSEFEQVRAELAKAKTALKVLETPVTGA